jgi:hypothetical protein
MRDPFGSLDDSRLARYRCSFLRLRVFFYDLPIRQKFPNPSEIRFSYWQYLLFCLHYQQALLVLQLTVTINDNVRALFTIKTLAVWINHRFPFDSIYFLFTLSTGAACFLELTVTINNKCRALFTIKTMAVWIYHTHSRWRWSVIVFLIFLPVLYYQRDG